MTPLKLEVHNNTRWGTAYGMVKRALELRQVRFHFLLLILWKWQIDSSPSIYSLLPPMTFLALSPPSVRMEKLKRRSLGQRSAYRTMTGHVSKMYNLYCRYNRHFWQNLDHYWFETGCLRSSAQICIGDKTHPLQCIPHSWRAYDSMGS